jgi:hypothetical protein
MRYDDLISLHHLWYLVSHVVFCHLPYFEVYDQQLHHYFHLMTLGIQGRLLTPWHEYVQYCYEVYAYTCVAHLLQVD